MTSARKSRLIDTNLGQPNFPHRASDVALERAARAVMEGILDDLYADENDYGRYLIDRLRAVLDARLGALDS